MQQPENPADENITNGLKIISYGVNSKGEYELTPDDVWQPVNVVNTQAWQKSLWGRVYGVRLSRCQVSSSASACRYISRQVNSGYSKMQSVYGVRLPRC
jgi:hypothetical protein